MPQSFRRRTVLAALLAAPACLALCDCQRAASHEKPSIEFSRVPPADEGSQEKMEIIEGRVKGARPGERIVLFSRSGRWWVQPFADQPFTAIQPDATWKSSTHPGAAYGALLVDSRYRPPPTVGALPEEGGPVLAEATVQGGTPTPLKTIQFSGYEWEIRDTGSDPGGSKNFYDPANVWTDQRGFLHLRITKQADRWVSSELKLSRSLGYGSYRFVVRDVSHLEPAAVFAMFTWDDSGPAREMDIEISRWGEPADKNAQYVIQPYVVPANTVRFMAPPGPLTYSMNWQPGRVTFRTLRGSSSGLQTAGLQTSGLQTSGLQTSGLQTSGSDGVAGHVFTSGIPSSGNERIHMNLYVYKNKSNPLRKGSEVIVEKFEFLP
jgi:hypothetical protein